MLKIDFESFRNGKSKSYEMLNENLNKTRKMLRDGIVMRHSAENLGYIDDDITYKIENGEIGRFLKITDFPEDRREDIIKGLRNVTIDNKIIKSEYENTEEFKQIRSMLESDNNLGLMYIFAYFYYMEDMEFEQLEILYNEFLSVRQLIKTHFKSMAEVNNKPFDMHFIDETLPNDKEHRTNNEILHDGIEKLKSYRIVKRVIDSLPKKMRSLYKKAPNELRDRLMGVANGFDKIEPVDKKERVWKNFFGSMRLDTNRTLQDGSKNPYFNKIRFQSGLSSFLDKPKPLEALISHAENYLRNNLGDRYQKLMEAIMNVNNDMGDLGANVVLDQNGIVAINVLSFRANKIINSGVDHCIVKWENYWNSYTSDYRLQYYLYNMNLDPTDQLSTIGITVRTDGSYSDCQTMRNNPVKDFDEVVKIWEKENDLEDGVIKDSIKPMSADLISAIEKKENANRLLVQRKDLTIDLVEELLNYGADINHLSGRALSNAVETNDLELVKYMLENGSRPNLYSTHKDAPINKVKSFEILKLLMEYGVNLVLRDDKDNEYSKFIEKSMMGSYDLDEKSGVVSNYIKPDINGLKYCINNGLDVNFGRGKLARICGNKCRISYQKYPNIIEDYKEMMTLIIDSGYNFKVASYATVRNLAGKGGGRLLPLLKERGILNELDEKSWLFMIYWTESSFYYVDERDKEYSSNIVKEYYKEFKGNV